MEKDIDKDVRVGEMVTIDDQRGEFIVQKVHPESRTADLMVVTAHPVKLKDVPVSDLNKNGTGEPDGSDQ
jgi:hypothetical protein